MRKFTVELFLPDDAVQVFEKYMQHMRGYINDLGDLPFRNMTDGELFQTAMFLGSDRMVSDKLWDAAFASHAITFEEYKTRATKEQVYVTSGTDHTGGPSEGEAPEHIGTGGQDGDIKSDTVPEDKETAEPDGAGNPPDSVHHIIDRG